VTVKPGLFSADFLLDFGSQFSNFCDTYEPACVNVNQDLLNVSEQFMETLNRLARYESGDEVKRHRIRLASLRAIHAIAKSRDFFDAQKPASWRLLTLALLHNIDERKTTVIQQASM
jgi:hypothetical protein